MKYVMTIFSLLAFAYGFIVFSQAASAIHEIEALVSILIGAVFFGSSVIVEEIQKLRKN